MRFTACLFAATLLSSAAHAQFDLPDKHTKKETKAAPVAAPVEAPVPAPVSAPAPAPSTTTTTAPIPPGFATPAPDNKTQTSVAAAVARMIRKAAGEAGVSHIKDRKLKTTWDLALQGVSFTKVVLADDTHAVATADFKSTDGMHALELDYTVEKISKSWRRKKVSIRSVDGNPRISAQELP